MEIPSCSNSVAFMVQSPLYERTPTLILISPELLHSAQANIFIFLEKVASD